LEVNLNDESCLQNVLGEAFRLTIESLLKENEEVPVKVEAAIALQMMLSSQDELAKKYVEPKIREITLELVITKLYYSKIPLTV